MSTIQPRQLRGFTVHPDGTIIGKRGKPLSAFPVKGYLRVTSYANGKYIAEPVHRLVCEAFHGPCPFKGALVRHLNGDPLDNRADNLSWGTWTDNEDDKRRHGRIMQGSRHHRARLTQEQVNEIRNTSPENTHTSVAQMFGVSRQNVSSIRRGLTWK